MSVIYQAVLTPGQAEAYLTNGFNDLCGFAVLASEVEKVTDIADLMDLFGCNVPGAPFAPDQPIHMLRFPASPFTQARPAVGPLHAEAILGGVIEASPFNPNGTVSGGGVETRLMWIEPTRMTTGAQIWRFHPDATEPELLGVYHGIAWGWETIATGEYASAVPSPFAGPVVVREWGAVPVDVDVEDGRPVAVTLVAAQNPPEEGFEQLPTGLWAKRIEYYAGLDIREIQMNGTFNNVPVRVVRPLVNEDGSMTSQCVATLIDTQYNKAHGFSNTQPGVYTILAPFEEIQNQSTREARTNTWNTEGRPAITLRRARPLTSNTEDILGDAVTILANIAPQGWTAVQAVVQIVGQQINLRAAAMVKEEQVMLSGLPGAFINYAVQVKQTTVKEEDGAPLFLTFTATRAEEGSANGDLKINYNRLPPFANEVPAQQWHEEIRRYPRTNIPEWLQKILDGEQTEDEA